MIQASWITNEMLISTESNQSIVYLLINNTVFFLLETRNKQFFSRHHNSAFYALLDVRNFLVFFGNNGTCHTTLATQNTISCYFHRISFTFRHFCTEYWIFKHSIAPFPLLSSSIHLFSLLSCHFLVFSTSFPSVIILFHFYFVVFRSSPISIQASNPRRQIMSQLLLRLIKLTSI